MPEKKTRGPDLSPQHPLHRLLGVTAIKHTPPGRPFFQAALALASGSVAGWTASPGIRVASLLALSLGAAHAYRAPRGSLGPGWLLLLGLCAGLRCGLLHALPSEAPSAYKARVGSSALSCPTTGVWRSLVAHLLWEQGVEGSNPFTPTTARNKKGVGASGRWVSSDRVRPLPGQSQRGNLGHPGDRLECLLNSVSSGERVRLLGPGSALRGAALPGAEAPIVSVALRVDELARTAPAVPKIELPGSASLALLRQSILVRLLATEDSLDPADSARGLLPALIVGERSGLSASTRDLFTRTGTRHLLALSGLHVSLLAWWIIWPLGDWLARALARALAQITGRAGEHQRRPQPWLGPDPLRALLLLALVPLAGGGAPIWRAAIALALAAVATCLPAAAAPGEVQHRGRRVDGLSLWGLALCLELLISPQSIAHLGLQLSYLATLALIIGLPALGATCPVRVKDTDTLGRARSPWWCIPAQRVLDGIWLGVASSMLAVVATLPVIWAHFGQIAPVGIVATPLAMLPLMGLLATGWLHACAPGILPLEVVHLPGRALIALLEACDQLPATPWPLPERPWPCIVLLTGLAFLGMTRFRRGGRRKGLVLGLALVLGGFLVRPSQAGPDTGAELVVLDVGHGTAALLRVPGEDVWLFDAGSKDRVGVATCVGEQLRRWQTRDLSVVVSHRDRDHSSALPWILERWPPRVAAGALEGTPGWEGQPIDIKRGRVQLPTRGQLELFLLRGSDVPGNEGSRCLEIRWGSWRGLLTGDAEQDGLAGLLEPGILEGPYDLVLLPHHGSESPHLDAFLRRCRPKEIWISCGSPAALGPELDRQGRRWSSTYRAGALVARPLFETVFTP